MEIPNNKNVWREKLIHSMAAWVFSHRQTRLVCVAWGEGDAWKRRRTRGCKGVNGTLIRLALRLESGCGTFMWRTVVSSRLDRGVICQLIRSAGLIDFWLLYERGGERVWTELTFGRAPGFSHFTSISHIIFVSNFFGRRLTRARLFIFRLCRI